MADAGQKASMAKDLADPATQGRNLGGPGPIVIEHDSLSEEQGEPCDPQIARVHEIRFPELAPKWESQAAAQVPQRRGAKWSVSADDRHACQRGCGCDVSLV